MSLFDPDLWQSGGPIRPGQIRLSITQDPELGTIVGVFDHNGVLQAVGSDDGAGQHKNHPCLPIPIMDPDSNDTPA